MLKCLICNSTNINYLLDSSYIRHSNLLKGTKSILQCRSCGLKFLYVEFPEELKKLYKKYNKEIARIDFKNQKYKVPIYKQIKKFCKPSDRILEIGASIGNTIKYLRSKRCKNSIGIDIDPTACDGRNVFHFSMEEFKQINKEKFDVIYSFHTLEHLEDPFEMLNFISSSLSNNGKAIIEIPNCDDPLLTLYKLKSYNKFYWYLFHNFFFNADTIEKLIQGTKLKYKIILKQRYGVINHLRWILFHKPGNINFHIPIVDDIYKLILTKFFKCSDTLVILLSK